VCCIRTTRSSTSITIRWGVLSLFCHPARPNRVGPEATIEGVERARHVPKDIKEVLVARDPVDDMDVVPHLDVAPDEMDAAATADPTTVVGDPGTGTTSKVAFVGRADNPRATRRATIQGMHAIHATSPQDPSPPQPASASTSDTPYEHDLRDTPRSNEYGYDRSDYYGSGSNTRDERSGNTSNEHVTNYAETSDVDDWGGQTGTDVDDDETRVSWVESDTLSDVYGGSGKE
jgi:hypothetical protein